MHGRERMIDPLVAHFIDVILRSEWQRIELPFGTLVDDRAVFTAERAAVGVGFDEVLIDLRADHLHEIPTMAEDRKITPDRLPLLQNV